MSATIPEPHHQRMSREDRERWGEVRNMTDLGQLTAAWLTGEVLSRPGRQPGYGPDLQLRPWVEHLALVNRAGYVTTHAQPGWTGLSIDKDHVQQYAAVTGFATATTVQWLRDVLAGTRYTLLVHPLHQRRLQDLHRTGRVRDSLARVRAWWTGRPGIVVTTSAGEPVERFGDQLGRAGIVADFDGCNRTMLDALTRAWQVTVVDPEPGQNDLWSVLAGAARARFDADPPVDLDVIYPGRALRLAATGEIGEFVDLDPAGFPRVAFPYSGSGQAEAYYPSALRHLGETDTHTSSAAHLRTDEDNHQEPLPTLSLEMDGDTPIPGHVPYHRVCSNEAVGVLITDSRGRHLLGFGDAMLDGLSPATGHRELRHDSFEATARDVVLKATGRPVQSLTFQLASWQRNRCRHRPGPLGGGHNWTVFRATVVGVVDLDAGISGGMHGLRWVNDKDLQLLAQRTSDYARGRIASTVFQQDPGTGLDPVWAHLLQDIGLVDLDPEELWAIDRLAQRSPYATTDNL